MQCVMLAAGEGTRMRPLTLETPKPLIEVAGKTILDHIIDALPSEITELILVVGYKADMVRAHCGDHYKGRDVSYVVQENPKAGTGDALFCAEGLVTGKFLLMYSDDIHGKEALQDVVTREHCVLAARSDTPERFGVFEQNKDGTLKGIIEKPKHPPSNFVNTGGGHMLTPAIFDYKPPLSELGEYLLTDSITDYAQDYTVEIVEQQLWIPIGYPEDVVNASKLLTARPNLVEVS